MKINQKDNNLKEGYYEEYRKNGTLHSKGYYKNNLRTGYWEWYHFLTNEIDAKGYYKNGQMAGYWVYYYYNGELEDKQFIFN